MAPLDFGRTTSIAAALERELGNRQGTRTDVAANAATSQGKTVDLASALEAEIGNRKGRPKKVSAFAETSPKGNTVDLAARRAGLGISPTMPESGQ